jgi:hypothetical protein
MATLKYKTEGGSGGKLGHSNMSHWDETEMIKEATKVRRRNNEKKEIKREIEYFSKDNTLN